MSSTGSTASVVVPVEGMVNDRSVAVPADGYDSDNVSGAAVSVAPSLPTIVGCTSGIKSSDCHGCALASWASPGVVTAGRSSAAPGNLRSVPAGRVTRGAGVSSGPLAGTLVVVDDLVCVLTCSSAALMTGHMVPSVGLFSSGPSGDIPGASNVSSAAGVALASVTSAALTVK